MRLLGSGLHAVIYGEPTKSSLKFIRNKIHPTGLQCSSAIKLPVSSLRFQITHNQANSRFKRELRLHLFNFFF